MTAKEFLQKGRKMNDEVQQLLFAKQQARELACSVSVTYSDNKTNPSLDNSMERKMTDYANYSVMLDKRMKELINYRFKMISLIVRLDDVTHRTLLIARYIDCKTWERIAEEMHYSDKWVRTHLHSKALQALDDILCGLETVP